LRIEEINAEEIEAEETKAEEIESVVRFLFS
jgi:hypothetical protein